MKKIIFVTMLVLLGAGAFYAWKMFKGDGGGWAGGGDDPWSSYTPPVEDEAPVATEA